METAALAAAVRKAKNPDYPITKDEILERYSGKSESSIQAFKFSLSTFRRQVDILQKNYPDHPKINELALSVRKSFMLYICSIIAILFSSFALFLMLSFAK